MVAVAALLTLCLMAQLANSEPLLETEQWKPSLCPDRCTCSKLHSERFQVSLRTVDCSHKAIVIFPSTMPSNTQVLLLRGNSIKNMGMTHLWLPELLELDLSNNDIRSLGFKPTFNGVSNLRYLDLSDNKLTGIHSVAFDGLFNLEELRLNDNRISTIADDTFRGLNKLETLSLGGNQLTYINANWFTATLGLYVLGLDRNHFTSLSDKMFQQLKHLRSLDLSENKLFRISPQGFHGLNSLEYLALNGNDLHQIPSAISAVQSLRSINLSQNPIRRLNANDFSGFHNLRDVNLANLPKLRLIDAGAFSNLPELLIVQLHDCPLLTYIDNQAFYNCQAVTHLWLHNNNLAVVEPETLDSLPSLAEVSFYGNPLACDCNARWLREAVQRKKPHFKEFERMVCEYPEARRFQLLASIAVETFSDTCAPTILDLFEQETKAKVGQAISFDCRAIGQPKPKIEWAFPNQETAGGNPMVSFTNRGETLAIHRVKQDDTGRYTCRAQNIVGDAQASTHLSVDRMHVQLSATPLGPAEVLLTWNGTDRTCGESVQIYFRPLVSAATDIVETQRAATVRSQTPFYTIRNLQPNTEYEACIAFENADTVIVQVSCATFQTWSGPATALVGVEQTTNAIVGAALGIVACLLIVACLAIIGLKQNRSKAHVRRHMSDAFTVHKALGDIENIYCVITDEQNTTTMSRGRLDSSATLITE